ncbi:MAG TPA: hypothetical protein VM537_32100, partial [Anaerolineae bacterium]|nr:hypothetical protein [Anaerolineae bacterium]
NTPPSVLETLPPRSHEEWLGLGEQLEAHRRDFGPSDFEGMIAQFTGPDSRVEGASLRDFRPDGSGFRFVLTLSPGFQFSGAAWPDLGSLTPGDYVVSYHDGFSIEPLTPAQVEVIPGSLRADIFEPVALDTVSIGIQLHNSGLTDLGGLEVRVYAALAGSYPKLVAEEVVEVLAGETVSLSIPWAPASPGDWTLSFVWAQNGDALLAPQSSREAVDLHVAAASSPGFGEIWRLSNVKQPLALLMALTCAGLSASALAMIFARSPVGDR